MVSVLEKEGGNCVRTPAVFQNFLHRYFYRSGHYPTVFPNHYGRHPECPI